MEGKRGKRVLLAWLVGCCLLLAGCTAEDNAARIASLSQVWALGTQLHPWWDLHDIGLWDVAYETLLDDLVNRRVRNDRVFYERLQEMLAILEDGHAAVAPTGIRNAWLPVSVEYIDGSYYLVEAGEAAAPLCYRVLQVDGRPVEEVARNVGKRVANKTPNAHEYQVGLWLTIGEMGAARKFLLEHPETGETLSRTYRFGQGNRDGVHWEEKRRENTLGENGFKNIHASEIASLYENETVYYLTLPTFASGGLIEALDSHILPGIPDGSKLIIDVRDNNGGNAANGLYLLSSLTDVTICHQKSMSRVMVGYDMALASALRFVPELAADEQVFLGDIGERLARGERMLDHMYLSGAEAGDEAFGNVETAHQRRLDQIVVLISHQSGSAVDDFAYYASQLPNVALMGTNTAGATGQIAIVTLRNGWTVQLSAARCQTAEGEEINGRGIQPDVEIWQSVEEWTHDTVLQSALNAL